LTRKGHFKPHPASAPLEPAGNASIGRNFMLSKCWHYENRRFLLKKYPVTAPQ
jgi:hypothetical protein